MTKVDSLKETPSQTAGPYVHIGCTPNQCGITGVYPQDLGNTMITGAAVGDRITLRGTVFDGLGTPMKDALIEIWQPDAAGLFAGQTGADPHFTGWGRSAGHPDTGEFVFETLRPGPVRYPDGRMQAPHITFWVVARGINTGLHTRLYFPDAPDQNATDPILSRIEHPARAASLIARAEAPGTYRFDIHLQGPQETAFLDI